MKVPLSVDFKATAICDDWVAGLMSDEEAMQLFEEIALGLVPAIMRAGFEGRESEIRAEYVERS